MIIIILVDTNQPPEPRTGAGTGWTSASTSLYTSSRSVFFFRRKHVDVCRKRKSRQHWKRTGWWRWWDDSSTRLWFLLALLPISYELKPPVNSHKLTSKVDWWWGGGRRREWAVQWSDSSRWMNSNSVFLSGHGRFGRTDMATTSLTIVSKCLITVFMASHHDATSKIGHHAFTCYNLKNHAIARVGQVEYFCSREISNCEFFGWNAIFLSTNSSVESTWLKNFPSHHRQALKIQQAGWRTTKRFFTFLFIQPLVKNVMFV